MADYSKTLNKDHFSEDFDPQTLSSLVIDIKTLNETAEILSYIQKILSNPKSQTNFLSLFAQGAADLPVSFFYFSLIIKHCENLKPRQLSELVFEKGLIGVTIKSLKSYLRGLGNDVYEHAWVWGATHSLQLSVRLRFLEIINKNSELSLSEKEEKGLMRFLYWKQPERTAQKLFFQSYLKGINNQSLSNNYFHSFNVISSSEVFHNGVVNKEFFKLFKAFFIKANQNYSLEVKHNKIFAVVNKDVHGFEHLVRIFYNAEKIVSKKARKKISVLLRCFALEAKSKLNEILTHLVEILICVCDKSNTENLERLIRLLRVLCSIKDSKVRYRVKITAIFPQFHTEINIAKKSYVIEARRTFAEFMETEYKNICFEIGNKKYYAQQNFEIIKFGYDDVISCSICETVVEARYETLIKILAIHSQFFYECATVNSKYRELVLYLLIDDKVLEAVSKHSISLTAFEESSLYEKMRKINCICYLSTNKTWLNHLNPKAVLEITNKYMQIQDINQNFSIEILDLLKNIKEYTSNFPSLQLSIYTQALLWLAQTPISLINENSANSLHQIQTYLLNKIPFPVIINLTQEWISVHMSQLRSSICALSPELKYAPQIITCLRNLISIGKCSEQVFEALISDFTSELQSPHKNYLFVFFRVLFKSMKNDSELKCKKIFKILLESLRKVYETDNSEKNENICEVLELLNGFPEFLETPEDFPGFASELVVSLPDQFSIMLPRCKHTETRSKAFKLIYFIVKADKSQVFWLVDTLKPWIHCKFWRTAEDKNFKIAITPVYRPKSGYKGLNNPACICYSNSIVQLLFHIPSFRDALISIPLKKEKNCLTSLQNLFVKLKHSFAASVSSKSLIKAFYNGVYNYKEQMDADEHLLRLFEKCLNVGDSKFEEVLSNHFLGTQVLEFISKDCGHTYSKEQNFWSLGLNIYKKEKNSLEKSLKMLTDGEVLSGENAFMCEKCKMKVRCLVKPQFLKLPNYFFFSIKRFEYDLMTQSREKMTEKFEFPLEMYFDEFLSKKCKKEGVRGCKYELKAVVDHIGVAEQGHYFAFVKTENEAWTMFNDSGVKEVSIKKVLKNSYGMMNSNGFSPSAYILVYEKCDKTDLKALNSNRFSLSKCESEQISTIIKKNDEIKIKELVLSEDFFDFIEDLTSVKNFHSLVWDFVLSCFNRSALKLEYFLKFYHLLKQSINKNSVEYVISLLSTRSGCIEFLIFANDTAKRKLFLLLIKEKLHLANKDIITDCIDKLVLIFFELCHMNECYPFGISDLFFILIDSMDPELYPIYLSDVVVPVLFRIKFKHPVRQEAHFGVLSQYYAARLKDFDRNKYSVTLDPFIEHLMNHLHQLEKKQIESLKSKTLVNWLLSRALNKKSTLIMNKFLALLYEDDLSHSFEYLNYMLEYSKQEKNWCMLGHVHLFLKYHRNKTQIFPNFIESFLTVYPDVGTVSKPGILEIYLVKFLVNVKFKDIFCYLTEEIVSKIEKVIHMIEITDKKWSLCGYAKNFYGESEVELPDLDDFILKSVKVGNEVCYFGECKESKEKPIRCIVIENFEDEVIVIKGDNERLIMLDSYSFERIY